MYVAKIALAVMSVANGTSRILARRWTPSCARRGMRGTVRTALEIDVRNEPIWSGKPAMRFIGADVQSRRSIA
jgi:hypothetical protein